MDRFSIPDESATIRGASEEGIKGKWENIYHPEELDASGSKPYQKGDRIRGGGLGGVDRFSEHPDASDPEMIHLMKAYKTRGRSDNRTFNQWLNDEPISPEGKKERFGVRIDLGQMGYDTELYENVFLPLSKIWTDRETKVKYVVGINHDDDEMIFQNREVVSVPVKTFNDVLGKQVLKSGDHIRTRVGRPEREDPNRFVEALRHLRLGSGTFKGEDVSAEFPAQKELDREGFHLGLSPSGLRRKVMSGKERGDVMDFWSAWAKVKDLDKSEVRTVEFDIKNGKISHVIMQWKDGQSIRIPSHIFRSVFSGVKPFKDQLTGEITGFSFTNLNGQTENIEPGTSPAKLREVMGKTNMNGKPLPPDTVFRFTNFEWLQRVDRRSGVEVPELV